jgi:hypothetical protein
MDLERITHPLRLARGSHQPGSGKGCAMNVISYINGDEQITDIAELHRRFVPGDMPSVTEWDGAARILEVTRNAIRSWRRLGGLSVVSNDPIPVAGVKPRKAVAA